MPYSRLQKYLLVLFCSCLHLKQNISDIKLNKLGIVSIFLIPTINGTETPSDSPTRFPTRNPGLQPTITASPTKYTWWTTKKKDTYNSSYTRKWSTSTTRIPTISSSLFSYNLSNISDHINISYTTNTTRAKPTINISPRSNFSFYLNTTSTSTTTELISTWKPKLSVPTSKPTKNPTLTPTAKPSSQPTHDHIDRPKKRPTFRPIEYPTIFPSTSPTTYINGLQDLLFVPTQTGIDYQNRSFLFFNFSNQPNYNISGISIPKGCLSICDNSLIFEGCVKIISNEENKCHDNLIDIRFKEDCKYIKITSTHFDIIPQIQTIYTMHKNICKPSYIQQYFYFDSTNCSNTDSCTINGVKQDKSNDHNKKEHHELEPGTIGMIIFLSVLFGVPLIIFGFCWIVEIHNYCCNYRNIKNYENILPNQFELE